MRPRIIPVLLITDEGVYKTTRFKEPKYIGDPINTARLFNDMEVDELVVLDIGASAEDRGPNHELIESLASECFMPLCYGGGIHDTQQAHELFRLGIEKICLNHHLLYQPGLLRDLSARFGSQSIVASIDVQRTLFGGYHVYGHVEAKRTRWEVTEYAQRLEHLGAGELLLTAVDRDGERNGYDLDLIEHVASAVGIPVVASGGAGTLEQLRAAIVAGASAAAAGSLFVFSGKHRAVLIQYPSYAEITALFGLD